MDFFGFFGLAEGYHRRGIAMAEKGQDYYVLGISYIGMAIHQSCLGKLDLAFQTAGKGVTVFKQARYPHQQHMLEHMQAHYLYNQGRFAQSLEVSRNVVRQGLDYVDPQIQCWGLTARGGAQRRLGNFTEGVQTLRKAVELADTVSDYGDGIEAGGELGWCLLGLGSVEEALAVLKETERIYYANRAAWGNDVPLF